MKTTVCVKYGPPEVLELREVKKPTPGRKEVLVKVRATTVTAGDVRMRRFDVPRGQRLLARMFLGIRKPRRPVLGMELAGDIEAKGKDVKLFREGDAVFASTFGVSFGGYAEYKCFPESAVLAIKPASSTYEEAAAVPVGGGTALRFLRKAEVRSGQKVLIYGASGSIGTFAVQLARQLGAEVAGVCSTKNLEMVRSLGAGTVIDYTRKDFTQRDENYDLVLDAVGKSSRSRCRRLLRNRGVFLSALGSSGKESAEDLVLLKELIETGEVRSVIDRGYPLERIAEAHRYVETGHKKGNVTITVLAPHTSADTRGG